MAKTKIIAVANQKGGVGKTTTAVHVAHGLALLGRDVLLIDLDPQGNCATALGLEQHPGVFRFLVDFAPVTKILRPTNRENLWAILGDKSTATAQTVINAAERPASFLRERLDELWEPGKGPHYVIFDLAPSLGGLQERALWAADYVLIPTSPDLLSFKGVKDMFETLKILQKKQEWKGKLLGVLPTLYDETTRESVATMEELKQRFPKTLFDPIHRTTKFRDATARGCTIFEFDSTSRAAQEYSDLVRTVLELN